MNSLLTALLIIFPIYSLAVKNVLNFSGNIGLSRVDDIRMVLDELKPDIFVVQEIVDIDGVNLILNQALNHSSKVYKKVPFFDGPFTDNAAFYNKKKIKLVSHKQIPTDLSDISEL